MLAQRRKPTIEFALRLYIIGSVAGVTIVGGIFMAILFPDADLFVLLFNLIYLAMGVSVAYLIASYIGRNISSPLQNMTEVATQVVEGLESKRIEFHEPMLSQVEDVSLAFNRLADKAVKDVSEMKRLERVRTEFLGNVSHELRTPIFSIQGYLETLLDGALEDKEVRRQFVERAYANAVRLNVLLSDLIDISKIESGEMKLSFRYFSLQDLVKDTVAAMDMQASTKDVRVILDESISQKISVLGDKERLSQVLTNLVDNAIKYNIPNGTVTISAKVRPSDVVIVVADTGIGIAAEHHGRIFERFYRVDRDRSRAVGGTGLGLAIVKHILEAHGSSIVIDSIPGSGTTISFTLKR